MSIASRRFAPFAVASSLMMSLGCSAPMLSDAEQTVMLEQVEETIEKFKQQDPTIDAWFRSSHGYAVFPKVTKGAAGVGGAHGQGVVFEQGEAVGSAALSQANIGFQLGGQSYSEVIFFSDQATLEDFQSGDFEFSAQASAVALTSGAAANADYSKGVAIFTLARGGLMYEASIGGQKFDYRPFATATAESDLDG